VITEHCDLANVRLEFPGGAVANLSASRVSAKPFRKLRIFSTEAYASVDFISNTVEVSYKAGNQIQRKTTEPMAMDSLLDQCRHFVARARDGLTPLVSGEDGALALRYAGIVAAKVLERAAGRPAEPQTSSQPHPSA
jgi:predicted dehydrogenase